MGTPKAKFVKNVASKSAEIFIYDDIGEGWFGGISAKDFVKELQDLGDVEDITVRLNSQGGSVFEGFAIYQALKRHSANVTTVVDGLAASIASVVAMAGDRVEMSDTALMMIHDPWYFAVGSARDFRKAADNLDLVGTQISGTYVKKTGRGQDEILDWMAEEIWFDADWAVEHGFADVVVEPVAVAAACINLEKYQFKNAPQRLVMPVDERHRDTAAWRKVNGYKARIEASMRDLERFRSSLR